jgi:hypothetical protein
MTPKKAGSKGAGFFICNFQGWKNNWFWKFGNFARTMAFLTGFVWDK